MIRKLLCRYLSPWPFYYFHKFSLIEAYDSQTRKLKCVHCHKYFAMSDRHRAILPWDEEYERITRDMYGVPSSKI